LNNKSQVQRWIEKADSDLNAVYELLNVNSNSRDVICFHCQQAVEKYLKGLLIALNVKFERMHDLVALLESLVEQHPELEAFKENLAILNVRFLNPQKNEMISIFISGPFVPT